MTRLRANYLFGELGGDMLVDDTAMTSPDLARMPVVTAPDVLAVTLGNPDGDFEIVHVTAHDDSETSATILRAQEGSTAAAWPDGAAWWHSPTALDFDTASPSPTLLSDKYAGAWSADSDYLAGQTVVYGSKLWEARVDSPTGEPDAAPVDDSVSEPTWTGGPAATSANFANAAAQAFTFTDSGVISEIRVATRFGGSTVRAGFTAEKPTTAEPDWLGYADMASRVADGAYNDPGSLSAAITVSAGQTLWAVVLAGGSQLRYSTPGSETGPVTSDDALWTSDSNDGVMDNGTFPGSLAVQGLLSPGEEDTEPPWALALDFTNDDV